MRTRPFLYVLALACGASPNAAVVEAPSTQTSVVDVEAPRVLLETPVFYNVPEGDGERTIHTPLVRARIGGVETLLILDTGASDSIFMNALGDAIGVQREVDETGTDHAGAAVPTFAATAPVELQIESFVATVPRMLFIDGPPPFEGWGVGGIVSPQLLSETDWVVLDLDGLALRIVEGSEEAVAGFVSAAHEAWDHASLARVQSTGDSARHIIVGARVEDHDARVMLNTGGRHTEVAPRIHPAVQGDNIDTGRGVSGTAIRGQAGLGTLVFRMDGLTVSEDDFIVREQTESYDAQIGIDVLHSDVLMLRAAEASTVHWWRAPR